MALRADDVDLERDRTLVQRYQAGDDDAFGELYRRYHDRLERFCRKRVADPHVAEEVAQEAFTRALTALPELRGELRFYPWVSVIAARLCVDAHRRQSRYDAAPSCDPGSVPDGQEDIIDAVDSSLVMIALARVAPRHRDVLRLREIEGWSYQRIATHYGVRVGTVETLLFRARRALRREFHLVDGAGLAALPMFGRVIQLAVRVRDRVPAWLPSASAPAGLAAAATATAAAVALAVAPSPGAAKASAAPPAVQAPAPRQASDTNQYFFSQPVAQLPETTAPAAAAGTTESHAVPAGASAPTPPTASASEAPAAPTTTTPAALRRPADAPPAAVALAGPVTAAVAGPVKAAVGSVTATALPLTSTLATPPLGAVASTVTQLSDPAVASLTSPPVDLGATSAPVVAATTNVVPLLPGL